MTNAAKFLSAVIAILLLLLILLLTEVISVEQFIKYGIGSAVIAGGVISLANVDTEDVKGGSASGSASGIHLPLIIANFNIMRESSTGKIKPKLNCHIGKEETSAEYTPRYKKVISVIEKHLKEQSIDILALEEVSPNFKELLTRHIKLDKSEKSVWKKYNVLYNKVLASDGSYQSMAMIFKMNIPFIRQYDIENKVIKTHGVHNKIMVVRFSIGKDTLTIVNLHLSGGNVNKSKRLKVFKDVHAAVESSTSASASSILYIGDFNEYSETFNSTWDSMLSDADLRLFNAVPQDYKTSYTGFKTVGNKKALKSASHWSRIDHVIHSDHLHLSFVKGLPNDTGVNNMEVPYKKTSSSDGKCNITPAYNTWPSDHAMNIYSVTF